jgi:hypothetical protein
LKSSYKPDRGWRRFRDAFRVWHQRSVGTCSGNQFQRFAPAGGRRDGKIIMASLDSFKCFRPLKVGSKIYAYYSLPVAEKNGLKGISRLPFSLKVLLENMLRHEDGRTVTKEDILAVAQWLKTKTSDREIAFRGRSRRHARCHEGARRRSEEDQPAGAG